MTEAIGSATEEFTPPAYSEELDRMLPGIVDATSRGRDDPDRYRFANCATATGTLIHKQDVVAAILATGGNYVNMAKLLSRTRAAVVDFVRGNEDVAKFRNDVFEGGMDEMEDMARSLALEGDRTMLKFMLTTKGKNRGYSTRVEHTGRDGKAMQVETKPPREQMEEFLNKTRDRIDGTASGIEPVEATVASREAGESDS